MSKFKEYLEATKNKILNKEAIIKYIKSKDTKFQFEKWDENKKTVFFSKEFNGNKNDNYAKLKIDLKNNIYKYKLDSYDENGYNYDNQESEWFKFNKLEDIKIFKDLNTLSEICDVNLVTKHLVTKTSKKYIKK
jgi:hypothetical protein